MNYKLKETGTATALRICFAIIMAITVGLFTNSIILHFTVFNDTFWKRTVMTEDIKEEIKDELIEAVKEEIKTQTPVVPGVEGEMNIQSIYDLETGDEFADEMIDFVMDEMIDMFIERDYEVDEDRFDEIFDEYGEDLYKELERQGVTREQFDESRQEMLEELNNAFADVEKQIDEEPAYQSFDLTAYKNSNIITMIVSGVINLIMIVVLIIIHKNKFRPVRAIGIATTVTEVFGLLVWAFLLGIFKATSLSLRPDEELFSMIIESASKSAVKVLGMFGIASFIGVVLIIAGCVGAGIVSRSYARKMKASGATVPAPVPAYAAPQAPARQYVPQQYVPVQQPAPVQQPVPVQPVPVQQAPVAPAVAAPAVQQAAQPAAWTCPSCGSTGITSNFCNNCGTKRP